MNRIQRRLDIRRGAIENIATADSRDLEQQIINLDKNIQEIKALMNKFQNSHVYTRFTGTVGGGSIPRNYAPLVGDGIFRNDAPLILREGMNTLTGHSSGVMSVSFSPDGARIVSGSDDNTVRVWDAVTGRIINTLTGHNGLVMSVSFSPDGSQIVSGSYDNTVRVWDAVTGEVTNTLMGHGGPVNSVSFSPDGSRIVSGSDDNTVRVWDAVTGEVINTLTDHNNLVP